MAEYESLPVIETLDDYTHFYEQLKLMRAKSEVFYPRRFAMELAVWLRLAEYDRKVGLPECDMPLGDGKGGLVERSPVPDAWRGESAL